MSDIGHTKTITSRMTFDQVQKLIEEKYAAGAKVKRMITWEIEDYCPSDDEWEIDIDVVHQDIYCVTRNLEEITGLIRDMIEDYIDADRKGDVWWTILVTFSDRTAIHTAVYAMWRYGDISIGEPKIVRMRDDE